jgi:general secretion pathway protein H
VKLGYPVFRYRGMTLLELLVVLAILAAVSGLAAMAYGPRSGRSQDMASQAAAILDRARAQAIAQGTVVRVVLHQGALVLQPTDGSTGMKLGETAAMRWTSDLPSRIGAEPAFFPDGSAVPGSLELNSAAGRVSLRVDWGGGVANANAAS